MTYYETSRPDWGFNTQPPEGGWMTAVLDQSTVAKFQHTAARRRLADRLTPVERGVVFQHTAARRRLAEQTGFDALDVQFQHTAARRRLGHQS